MAFNMAYPYFPESEIEWILNEFSTILHGKGMLSMSKHVKEFENEFARYVGTSFAVGTNSCTAALEIALRSIGLQEEDEVIVPVETFFATGSSVVREGGRLVFAEISPETFCLTLESIKEKLTRKTKAVIIVHMAGMISPEIFEIKKFCDTHNLFLIEDAAHAHGAEIDGIKAGNIGNVACFSFFPTKIMTTGEGGMLTTSDQHIHQMSASYRNRGLDLNAKSERFVRVGTNNRMSEVAAIMGRSQLRCLDQFLTERNRVARIYDDIILNSDVSDLFSVVQPPSNIFHSYWRYIVSLEDSVDRDKLKILMAQNGVPIDWAYYPPLHLQPVFKDLFGNKEGTLPLSEKLLEHNICLPMHAQIQNEEAVQIANVFISSVKKNQ